MAACDNLDDTIEPIRVLVANLSGGMLQLLTEQIKQQGDMQLTGQIHGAVEVLVSAGENVDVLVLGSDQKQGARLPGICSHLLAEYPHLKILVIGLSGEVATLYWLGLRQRQLNEVSRAALMNNIRYAHKLNVTV